MLEKYKTLQTRFIFKTKILHLWSLTRWYCVKNQNDSSYNQAKIGVFYLIQRYFTDILRNVTVCNTYYYESS